MLRYCVGLLVLIGCSGTPVSDPKNSEDTPPVSEQGGVSLRSVAQGFIRPVYLTSPAGDSRQFVVEQAGRIRVIENGQLLSTPFLDITSRVGSGSNEQGLLSVAFHPSYATNGFFYVNYTDLSGDTQVERYRVSSDRNRADAASAKRILSVDQPYANHNGGHILFGPDGMLYIAMGDGGSGGDPQGHGQNLGSLLGKLLRIDVDRGDPYSIPANNPFVGRPGSRGEIWAYGLRNPWRVAFDRGANQLYIADVGQNAWEEVHVSPAGQGGINYGWNRMEGTHCFSPSSGCDRSGLAIPQVEYSHSEGNSITGGYVYRGTQVPALVGRYLYADYGRGWVRSFRYTGSQVTDPRTHDLGSIGQVLSFGEDASGELYVLSQNGTVYKFAPT